MNVHSASQEVSQKHSKKSNKIKPIVAKPIGSAHEGRRKIQKMPYIRVGKNLSLGRCFIGFGVIVFLFGCCSMPYADCKESCDRDTSSSDIEKDCKNACNNTNFKITAQMLMDMGLLFVLVGIGCAIYEKK